jgi:hypothetical protein
MSIVNGIETKPILGNSRWLKKENLFNQAINKNLLLNPLLSCNIFNSMWQKLMMAIEIL